MISADLKRGKKGEKEIIDLFKGFGHLIAYNSDETLRSFHDLEFSLIDQDYRIAAYGSIEVKNDEYAVKTGNLAIEFYNGRSLKPSGINVTKSDLWAQIAFSQVWIANTKRLQRFVRVVEPYSIKYGVGDGNADIYLFKKDRIFDGNLFCRIDHLDSQNFFRTITQLLQWQNTSSISTN